MAMTIKGPGRRFPSEETLKDISHLLNVRIDDLKAHDTRPPIEEMKRATAKDPRYAFAFRTLLDRNISPEELLRLAEGTPGAKKKQT
jgi:hypothetical protein